MPPLHGRIALLPPELCAEIFIWCAIDDPLAPLTLQRISNWWRMIVNSSPRVWCRLRLDDHAHSVPCLRRQAELWLQRSKPLPIDVELNVQTPDLILSILSPLLPHISRWHSFSMQGQKEETLTLLRDANPRNDSLTDLCVSLQDDLNEKNPHQTFFTHNGQFTMKVYVLQIPSSSILTPLRVVNLRLTEDSLINLHSHPREILDFLSACPELQTFYFRGWQHDEPPPTDPISIVSLPCLHTLELKNTCMTRIILSHIDTPRLTRLYLAHLNTEFALAGDYHEDGDSEDEARDFSQSPSTDRATGMGLRNLIKRCNPPIECLDMDFSDLRTKDFRFIFDRLALLRDFLIVASDMSDTVIGLLRPFTLIDDQTPRVRLPLLKTLAFYNCNRLSGDAVVNALSDRVRYTDRDPNVETLNSVAVVTCDGFHHEHGAKLAQLLGKRLQLA